MIEIKRLTDLELEIMDILWESQEGMMIMDISKASGDKISIPSVNQVIPRLIKKSMIEVIDFKIVNRKYARVFAPLISREEYITMELKRMMGSSVKNRLLGIKGVVHAFMDHDAYYEDGDALIQDLKEYMDELEQKE